MPKATESPEVNSCLLQAWEQHQPELLRWLRHRLSDHATAHDLLQDVFLKALRQGAAFCDVSDARAWLFEVARNTLVDHFRRCPPLDDWSTEQLEQLPAQSDATPMVAQLTGCLSRVLTELDVQDADIIQRCDLEGMRQQDYAVQNGLSLSATKARLRRARERLRTQLTRSCQVQVSPVEGVLDFVPRP